VNRPANDIPAGPIERHYTTAEAAVLIGMTSGSLRNLRVESKGPRWIVTRDKRVLYPASALAEYLGQEQAA
jgi:hypothetical protein